MISSERQSEPNRFCTVGLNQFTFEKHLNEITAELSLVVREKEVLYATTDKSPHGVFMRKKDQTISDCEISTIKILKKASQNRNIKHQLIINS